MIENGTLLQDRYLVEKQIGAGGMGAVYRAVDQRFGSFVAIKETFYKNDELGAAFEREAHLLNSLLHPVLPHVSDFFTEAGGHFLVMQFIEGEDLFEVLKREGAFPAGDVLRWTDSLLDALDYLHSHEPPVIHRDIKPQNLKITPRGDVILLDFGLAKLNSDDTQAQLSVFGYSRKYSPLEQIQGTGTDARSDLFALAATTYHLLTGKPPLDALRRASAIIAGNSDPLPLASELNSEISVGVASVLNSALALNPAQRFISAKAMRQALEHTIKSDLVKRVEELPQPALPIAVDDALVNSGETEDFPALESFAGEVNGSSTQINDTEVFPAVGAPASSVNSALPVPEFTQATSVVETQTIISPRSNQTKFPFAAATAVVLLGAVLAAGYFFYNPNSPPKSIQIPTVQQSEDSAAEEQFATDLESPQPEFSESTSTETPEKVEIKPVVIKTKAEKRPATQKQETVDEPDGEIDLTENTTPETGKTEVLRPAPVKNKSRTQPQNSGETRTRVIESPDAPDIESIFTGRPADASSSEGMRGRQEERRRQQREKMSDVELREMGRQRRQERRQRQNSQPFPF